MENHDLIEPRRPYQQPCIEAVELRMREAVLATGCKMYASATTANGVQNVICNVNAQCLATTSTGS